MFVSFYITVKDTKEARSISERLVKERLIACANIVPRIESIYRWDNKIQRHREAAIIGKATNANKRKIIALVKELHSDSVPCIVFWPIADGNKDYLEWVKRETK